MPASKTRAASMRAHWEGTSPEQRREATRNARRAHAVKELVDQAPLLTEEQKARIRAALSEVPEHEAGAA
jgi:hypothetical protein